MPAQNLSSPYWVRLFLSALFFIPKYSLLYSFLYLILDLIVEFLPFPRLALGRSAFYYLILSSLISDANTGARVLQVVRRKAVRLE